MDAPADTLGVPEKAVAGNDSRATGTVLSGSALPDRQGQVPATAAPTGGSKDSLNRWQFRGRHWESPSWRDRVVECWEPVTIGLALVGCTIFGVRFLWLLTTSAFLKPRSEE